MVDFNFKDQKSYDVPKNLEEKIQRICITNVYVNEDVNEILSEFLVKERNIKKILFKDDLNWIDWKNLKTSCNNAQDMAFKNNGILMEFLGQIIITQMFNIRSLIKYHTPNFETPEQGTDIIFYNDNLDIFIYEVKSKVSRNNNIEEFCKKIKNALTSLYCAKELRNQKKLALAREEIQESIILNKENKDKLFNIIQEIDDNNNDFEKLSEKENITLNICVIGNGFDITQDELNNNLYKYIYSTLACKENCANADRIKNKCLIDRLSNIKIINVISLEFAKELELSELNKQIVKRIEEEGLDIRNG